MITAQPAKFSSASSSARKVSTSRSLVGAAEVEGADIGAGADLLLAEAEDVEAVGNLLPDILVGPQMVARLVDIAEPDGRPDPDLTGIGLLLAGDQPEQGGLAGAVGADHPDDATRRQAEGQVLEQQFVAIGLGQPLGVDD